MNNTRGRQRKTTGFYDSFINIRGVLMFFFFVLANMYLDSSGGEDWK